MHWVKMLIVTTRIKVELVKKYYTADWNYSSWFTTAVTMAQYGSNQISEQYLTKH